MTRPSALRRTLERELVDGLAPRRRRALIERLRGNDRERRGWDRAVAAVRVLEDRPVSRFELDQVERWLFEDLASEGVVAAPVRRRFAWLGAGLAALASAAALALWIGGDATDAPGPAIDDTLIPRGDRGFDRPLAIEPVCGQPPRPARDRGCVGEELLGFSIRLGAASLEPEAAAALGAAPLHLSLFGVGEDGEVRYYLPTPGDSALPGLAIEDRWQPLPLSIRLGVNHQAGTTRVFALASPEVPSVADIDRLAAALAPEPRASVDDPPWHLRLPRAALGSLCREPERCASAETEFVLIVPDSSRTRP